jgi:hypothetical protein
LEFSALNLVEEVYRKETPTIPKEKRSILKNAYK